MPRLPLLLSPFLIVFQPLEPLFWMLVNWALLLLLLFRRLFPARIWWLQINRCKALAKNKRWAAAEQICQEAIALNPGEEWAHSGLTDLLIQQERWLEALSTSQTELCLRPNDAWAHDHAGRIQMGLGQNESAIAHLTRAIELDGRIGWFYYHLGEAYGKLSQWDAAEAALGRSIDLLPNFPWSKYYLGQTLLAQGKLDDVVQLFERAKKQHPNIDSFRQNIGYLQYLQFQDQQIETYCKAYQARKAALPSSSVSRSAPLDILMVAPQPTEPPNSGGAIRMHHQAKSLGKKHHLVLVAFIFDAKDYGIHQAMADYCALPIVVLKGDYLPLDSDCPNLIHLYGSQQLTQILKKLQAIDFDIACFDFIYTAQYRHLFPHAYTVLGEHNIESDVLRRFNQLKSASVNLAQLSQESTAIDAFGEAEREVELLTAYEERLWPQFSLRTVVSENDKTALESRCPAEQMGETWVITNGIDTHSTPLLHNPTAQKLLFFGTLNYFPNIDGASYLVQEIMPLIWQEQPELKLCITGRQPPETILNLARRDDRIQVIADPDTIEEVAQDCCLSLVPLRVGGGTRLKILHAMALGLPNVSTSLGCEGLAGQDGEHLLIRDQPEAFAQAVLLLLREPGLWEKLHRNGRSLVEERYDWQAIYQDYEARLVEAWRWDRQAGAEGKVGVNQLAKRDR